MQEVHRPDSLPVSHRHPIPSIVPRSEDPIALKTTFLPFNYVAHVTSGVNLPQNHRFEFPYDLASACRLDPIEDAAVRGPIKAKPFGWPRKPRPALTGPARGGVRPGGRDERMLAARIEPKNRLEIQTARFRPKSDWR